MHVYYLVSPSLQNIKTVPGDDKASKECPSNGVLDFLRTACSAKSLFKEH